MKTTFLLLVAMLFMSNISNATINSNNATKNNFKSSIKVELNNQIIFSEIVEGGSIIPSSDKKSSSFVGYICNLISSVPWSYVDMAGNLHSGVTNTYSCVPIPPMMP